jgi:hypothetical protein
MTLSIARAAAGRVDAFNQACEQFHVCFAFGRNPAILRQMSAQGIGKLGALADQQIAGTEYHAGSLLLLGCNRNEAHAGALRCLADSLGIDRIVLCRFTKGLTKAGGMRRTLCPSCESCRAQ